jgi:Fur family ferric uptake transcriptional regulator
VAILAAGEHPVPEGRVRNPLQVRRASPYTGRVPLTADEVLDALRRSGYRMTPQRRAIVAEVMRVEGHIAPQSVARRVGQRMPGVNPSTVYRTLGLLEAMGVVSHAHLEGGAEYHRAGEGEHVHLVCSSCGAEDDLDAAEGARLKRLIGRHNGFSPDLTHFAISGLCADCRRGTG